MEIHKLPSDVVDKIAAGEVVERPAHLLKELIENSLDAGADEVEISIDEGGKTITIVDNGGGVSERDLPLVFARHATSKIAEADDLWNLSSFGFRGEALASISSVSKLNFISRQEKDKVAHKISCDFGKVGDVTEVSSQKGTTIQVDDLFGNVPARLKFLKSDSAEVSQIKNVIKALALANPQVQWKVKHKGKLLFYWEKTRDVVERAQAVLGVKKLYHHRLSNDFFDVEVVYSDPSSTVRVSRQIWLFVQGRWVQDRTIQAAVMESYRSLLMHGEYPYCVVSLRCPADQVDVNIHPTKSQVKFLHQKETFRSVHHCLRESLEKAPWIPVDTKVEKPTLSVQEPEPMNLGFQEKEFQTTQFQKKFVPTQNTDLTTPIRAPQVHRETSEDIEEGAPQQSYWSKMQVVGQVDLTYIVAQTDGEMILVDQHAAHERLIFERLMKNWKKGQFEQQRFLIPIHLDLDEVDVTSLVEMSEDLKRLGIEIEQSGPSTVSIQSCPSVIKESGLVSALQKLAAERTEKGGSYALETSIADVFATMACHSVIRAGQSLSHEEMKQLLMDMDEYPLSSYCPHGRNVSIRWSFVQLEKDFGRRV